MVDNTSDIKSKTLNFLNLEELFTNLEGLNLDNLTITNADKVLTPDDINKLAGYLNDGAKFQIEFKGDSLSTEEVKSFFTNLKFGGFLKVHNDNNTKLTGTRKAWKKNKNKNQWKNIASDYKGDLIVEDELVDPFDNYQKFSKESDCITKPKPCKNCNCGRADKENQENRKKIDPNFKPECGKCYLGDAFRCAGCPYRGLPAFEPGQKIDLNNAVRSSDVGVEEEKIGINVKDKKVKLDL
jgi:anamorsin